MNDQVVSLKDLGTMLDDKIEKAAIAAVANLTGNSGADNTDRATGGPDRAMQRRGNVTRDRKFTLTDDQKGLAAARFVRAIAFGKGNPETAAYFIDRVYDDDLGDEVKKALLAGELTAGGALVPPEYAAEIIELLRSATIVRRAGARTLPMNNGSLTLRRQTAGSSAAYVGESQDIGVTRPGTDLLTLTAKKLAAIVPISNDLLKFTSSPAADEFVRDDLVMEIAIREDLAFLRDDGTEHKPKGIRNWVAASNITASNGLTSTDIEDDFKDLLNDLEGNDVRLIRPAWFMHPSRKNHLRNLRDANGNLIFPETRGPSPTLYGWPLLVTTSIPSNLGVGADESEIYFTDMIDVIIGEADTLEIVASSEGAYVEGGNVKSAFSRDETLIRAITQHDIAMRHDVSGAVKTGVLWGQ